MTHPYLDGTGPRVLAHRGLVPSGEDFAPNSFAAIAAAQAAGVDYVESDCHLTSDGVVVLFHDETLASVTGDPRRVAEVTSAEMEELMADRGGLPTLSQVLDAFPSTRFNIDVKAEAAAVPAGRIVAKDADRVLLTSFSDERRAAALAAAGPQRPATSPGRATVIRLLLAVLFRARRRAMRLLADLDALQIPERYGPIRVLSRRLLSYAHEAGTEVHVWTVNEAQRMRELIAMGVDGVVTDRADVALEVVAG